jgi:hypothetical protein
VALWRFVTRLPEMRPLIVTRRLAAADRRPQIAIDEACENFGLGMTVISSAAELKL